MEPKKSRYTADDIINQVWAIPSPKPALTPEEASYYRNQATLNMQELQKLHPEWVSRVPVLDEFGNNTGGYTYKLASFVKDDDLIRSYLEMTEYLPDVKDWNPSQVEHLIKGYFGGVGRFGVDFVHTMIQVVSPQEEVDLNNVPFINSFIRDVPEEKWQTENQIKVISNDSRKARSYGF